MKKIFFWLALFCILAIPCLGEDRWAFVIGISDYPSFQDSLPSLRYAQNDAEGIADLLCSDHCQFSKDKVILLTGKNSTLSTVRSILAQELSRTKPQDFVFFFFVGHGIRKDNTFYLLMSDSHPKNIEQTALSLNHLADFFDTCIPARKLLLCLDANRSGMALSNSWYDGISWSTPIANKEVCVLQACAPYQIAQEKGGTGIFCHFLKKALKGIPYLGSNADSNKDGLVTVSELAEYLRWNIRLSGMNQYPIFWGKNECVLSVLETDSPFLEVKKPFALQSGSGSSSFEVAGFVRWNQPIRSFSYQGSVGRIGTISEKQAARLQIIPWKHTSWFALEVSALPQEKQILVSVEDETGKSWKISIPLPWRELGWHGEWMPQGMKKKETQGHYVWEKDKTEMVFIPEGPATTGISGEQLIAMESLLRELKAYLLEQKDWYESDQNLRKNLVQNLEQSNETIRNLAQKIQSIYKKTAILETVQREVSPLGTKKEDDSSKKMQSPIQKEILPEQKHFFSLSQYVLNRCYEDLHLLSLKQIELKQTVEYVDILLQKTKQWQSIWQNKILLLPAFYIDRYEISNLQYRQFCDSASRPYPPFPSWAEEYFFEDNYPVVYVSWEDASAYSLWSGKKLPKSSQWEKAARGMHGYSFPWGQEEPNMENANADVPPPLFSLKALTLPKLAPQEIFSLPKGQSPFGCHHIAGNVHEWIADLSLLMHDHSSHLPGQEYRITKGGSYASHSLLLASWFEHPFPAITRRSDLGFRCIVELP
ncbi:MAG: SUMF1/EgtB/PvdO family nonheme iron enzyme [Candidatus Brocadiae bacterium]|nr:SUMF1/EgtB/PvdO family nonheme iron enzyme [Candidatus Brocadiia bacterium]